MSDKLEKLEKELVSIRAEYENLRASNDTLNQRVLELYTLYNVSRTLSMSLQLSELFDLAMDVIGKSLAFDKYFLMLKDKATQDLSVRASHGIPIESFENGEMALATSLAEKVASSGMPVLVQDLAKEAGGRKYPKRCIKKGSFMGVPLVREKGQPLGVISALKTKPDGFGDNELRLFLAVAEHVAIAVENALIFKRTQELSTKDDLTGLYNRRHFFERFERETYRADRYGRPVSLLMVDIDHFKNYNDSYGHLRGDKALARLSSIMKKKLRKVDTLARYGGEEFLVLLPETDKRAASIVGEKLRAAVETEDFNQDDPSLGEARLTVTIGVAAMPDDTEDPKLLLDLSDKALYYGKAQGRNQVCAEVPESPKGT